MNCKNVDCEEARATLSRVEAMRHRHYDECPAPADGTDCAICKVYDQIGYSIAWEGDRSQASLALIHEALGS